MSLLDHGEFARQGSIMPIGHLPMSTPDLPSPDQLALATRVSPHMNHSTELSLGSFLNAAPYDASMQERFGTLAPSPLPATGTVPSSPSTQINHSAVQPTSTATLPLDNHYTMQSMSVPTHAPMNDPNMVLQQMQTNSAASFAFQQQQSVHPLDAAPPLSWSMNNLEAATVPRVKMEPSSMDPFSPPPPPPSQSLQQHAPFAAPLRSGVFQRSTSLTFHPSLGQVGTVPSVESPEMAFSRFSYNSSSPTTPMARELSSSSVDCSPYDAFDTCEDPPIQYIPRHSSVGCIYPVSQSRKLLEHSLGCSSDMGSMDNPSGWKPGPAGHSSNAVNKPRRASLSPDGSTSISATVNATSSTITSLRAGLGLKEDVTQHQHQRLQRQQKRDASAACQNQNQALAKASSVADPYPSLQPWMDLECGLKYTLPRPVTRDYVAPRHPIVLCHGLFGFDKIGPESIPHLQIHYWSGIQKALKKLGAKVLVARVSRTGAIRRRAEELHQMLASTVEGMPVNLLAHSMGGLDCRYLISHIRDKTYSVSSLTTLSTPHRGSPFMDWCRDHFGVGQVQQGDEEAMRYLGRATAVSAGAATAVSTMDQQSSISEHTAEFHSAAPSTSAPTPQARRSPTLVGNHPISPLLERLIPLLDTPAYSNLTTTYCREVFNPNTPDDPTVAYYSYGASAGQIPFYMPLGLPWEVIQSKEGANDGLVSLSSAQWGQYVETVEADHWDLNNRWRLKLGSNQKPFNAVDLYMNIATRLYNCGY
ncbi:hypothetical protein BGZ73_000984 [Actinomortierella ambigua]|nr:hypothetical protein BGZ73_000984 [Actinomortierella ambigua]